MCILYKLHEKWTQKEKWTEETSVKSLDKSFNRLLLYMFQDDCYRSCDIPYLQVM